MIMADNNENKVLNVPLLRFPEFTDEWKESVLSDFVERVKRKNKNNLCKLPLTISAQYGLVDQISFFNKVIASENMSNYYLLHKGDFAYNKSYSSEYPWGAIKRLDCYEQGTLSSLYICFKPYSHVSSDFLTHYFETSKWHQGISEIAVEGARNHGLLNVGIQDFFETRHCLPQSLLEQEKIAKFLNLIEERIATQNKIIEDLKKLKSAITDLLFHSIADAHTIRLGEIAHITNGAGDVQDANTEHQEDWYPFFDRSEELKWFPTYSFDKEAVIYAGEGQSFYPRYYNGKFALHQRCYAITDFASCIIPKYCYHFMNTLNSYFVRNSVGSTVPSLRMDIFQKVEIRLPPIPKQQHICKIIDAFYTKLEVEQRGISILQELKQFLLSQMFI
jgi:type I restriction enzyme S subunit